MVLEQQDHITNSPSRKRIFVLTEVRGRVRESVYLYRMITKFCSVTCLVSRFSDESKMKMVEKHPISTLFQQTWHTDVSLDYV